MRRRISRCLTSDRWPTHASHRSRTSRRLGHNQGSTHGRHGSEAKISSRLAGVPHPDRNRSRLEDPPHADGHDRRGTRSPRRAPRRRWRLCRSSRQTDDLGHLSDVPLSYLAVAVLGVPLAAAAAGWLVGGREPPTIARSVLSDQQHRQRIERVRLPITSAHAGTHPARGYPPPRDGQGGGPRRGGAPLPNPHRFIAHARAREASRRSASVASRCDLTRV